MRFHPTTAGALALVAALLASIPGCNDTGSGEGTVMPPTADSAAPPGPGAPVSGANVADAPAPSASPSASPAASGPLNGLYMRVYNSGGSLIKTYYLFSPSGEFTTIPYGGVDPFDFAAAARAYPDSTGKFTLEGDRLKLRYASGKTEDMKFAVTKEGVELDDLFAFKAEPYPPGSTLEGRYSGSEAATGLGGVGDRASSARTYVFKKDSTYEMESLGAVVAAGPTVEGSAGSGGSERGSYTLSGNTLVLSSSDGKQTRLTIFPYEDYNGKIELNINGMFCKPIP